VAHPGNEQGAQWLQIRQIKPDWVILRGWGVMNPVALKSAAKVGFPRDPHHRRLVVGRRRAPFPRATRRRATSPQDSMSRRQLPSGPGDQEICLRQGKGVDDQTRIGSIYYNRGVVHGIVTVEAIRKAQEKYGKNRWPAGSAGVSRTCRSARRD
jgi:branched-chain amino acid transport system substrate-binding protein